MSADAAIFSSTAMPTVVEGAERVVLPRRHSATRPVGAVVLNVLLYVNRFPVPVPVPVDAGYGLEARGQCHHQ